MAAGRLQLFARDAWWKRTDELYETVRIGAGLAASGRLSDEAISRGLETLAVFHRFCRANRLASDDVHVVATSAIRDAANGAQFLADAERATGMRIETLSAHDEAWFGYVAAINTTTLSDGVVLDLGGGSMQLIEVEDRHAGETASFPLGRGADDRGVPARLGPAKKKELARAARPRARDALRAGLAGGLAGARLVGIGGAVRNLAAAAQSADGPIDLGVQGFVLTPEALSELLAKLAALPPDERGTVSGIKPGRGDIILAAAVVLETVLELGGFDGIEATEAGLRDGVFLARTLLTGPEPLFENVREAGVRNLAIQYESDLKHVEHVARLSLQMFDSLVGGELFSPVDGERELLWAASMLHDVGMTISYDDHHKHSRYLIESAELPGFDPARARPDRADQPLSPQGRAQARRDRAADPRRRRAAAGSLRGDPAAFRAPRARPRSVGLPSAPAGQRPRRRSAPRGRGRPDASALERGALRRRRCLRARVRPAPADRLTTGAALLVPEYRRPR